MLSFCFLSFFLSFFLSSPSFSSHVIVLLIESKYTFFRFQKHSFSLQDLLSEAKQGAAAELYQWASDVACPGVRDEAQRQQHLQNCFVGYNAETIPSLVHCFVKDPQHIQLAKDLLTEMVSADTAVRSNKIQEMSYLRVRETPGAFLQEHVIGTLLGDRSLNQAVVTTFSPLVHHGDLVQHIVPRLTQAEFEILKIQDFDMEQTFRRACEACFKKKSIKLLVLSCDAGSSGPELVSFARYKLEELIDGGKGSVKKTKVLWIIHCKRQRTLEKLDVVPSTSLRLYHIDSLSNPVPGNDGMWVYVCVRCVFVVYRCCVVVCCSCCCCCTCLSKPKKKLTHVIIIRNPATQRTLPTRKAQQPHHVGRLYRPACRARWHQRGPDSPPLRAGRAVAAAVSEGKPAQVRRGACWTHQDLARDFE